MKLNMEERHWAIVKKILAKYLYAFYAFGSRTKTNAKVFSWRWELTFSGTDSCPWRYHHPWPRHPEKVSSHLQLRLYLGNVLKILLNEKKKLIY